MAGLYIHIPFCEHKCVYCDFYSIAPNGSRHTYEELIKRFQGALNSEIDLQAARFQTSFDTVFFGGGTPSLLSPSNIGDLLNRLSRAFSVSPKAEITLETNPGTVDSAKLREFRQVGVNRLSVGIQSFHDDDLKFLTRVHTSEQAKACVRDAFRAGFDNVSLDLIFSLPGQTAERWHSNLEQAVELEPLHLSCYSLIVEPNTPLFRMVQAKQVVPLGVDADAELYEHTMDFLARHGYMQYEVSNFARHGYKSRHNSGYWSHENYLGFGPSAHSFWDGKRWWNIANIVGYAERLERDALPVAGEECLTVEQLREEEIFLGLRSEGIDVAGFRRRFQSDLLEDHKGIIDRLLYHRLARLEGTRLRLTPRGYALCDEICTSFFE